MERFCFKYIYVSTDNGAHLRKTSKKVSMSNETIALMKSTKTYQMERELYDFAQDAFNYVMRESTFIDDDGKRKLLTTRIWEYYILRYPRRISLPPGWKDHHT